MSIHDVPPTYRRRYRHRFSPRFRVVAAGGAVAAIMMTWLMPSANAATTFTLVKLTAQVSGTSVTASGTVKASVSTAVDWYGVCVRGASETNLDFWKQPTTISTAGTTTPAHSKSFTPGTYRYFVCLYSSGAWQTIGGSSTFTVPSSASAPSAPAPAPTASVPASTTSSAPVGDLPGWRQTYRQDFTTNAAVGQVGSVYGQLMRGYDAVPDTSGIGRYSPDRVLSVSGGVLRYNLHTENGRPLVAAPVPLGWEGQTYGRFSVRLRTNATAGYKLSFLLWPASNNWNEGEIDGPEGNFGHAPYGASKKKGAGVSWDPAKVAVAPTDTSNWHVATTEWSPGLVRWLWDGAEIGRTTNPSTVPNTRFRWILQAETSDWNLVPAASAVGDVQVDWLAAYAYAS